MLIAPFPISRKPLSPCLPGIQTFLFNNLGSSFRSRLQRTRDVKDVHSAIVYHQKAVDSTPYGHTDLPTLFNNLGNSFQALFESTGKLNDVDCAIAYCQKAVDSTKFLKHSVISLVVRLRGEKFNCITNAMLAYSSSNLLIPMFERLSSFKRILTIIRWLCTQSHCTRRRSW